MPHEVIVKLVEEAARFLASARFCEVVITRSGEDFDIRTSVKKRFHKGEPLMPPAPKSQPTTERRRTARDN